MRHAATIRDALAAGPRTRQQAAVLAVLDTTTWRTAAAIAEALGGRMTNVGTVLGGLYVRRLVERRAEPPGSKTILWRRTEDRP